MTLHFQRSNFTFKRDAAEARRPLTPLQGLPLESQTPIQP